MNNCFDRARFVSTRMVRSLPVLSLMAVVTLLLPGCCTAIADRQFAGTKPPKMSSPKEIADNLKTNVNGKVGGFSRVAAFAFTPFKRLGILGWRDLGYDGEITAVVQQTAKSTDEFYTVDMKLVTLQIGGEKLPLSDDRYLRAEVCLCEVKLAERDRPKVGEKVWMRGRMMWDGDGFIEIHPRNATEVRRMEVAAEAK